MVQPVVRPLGYTGSLQQLIWDQGDNVLFRAYLFGGGGGAGGTSYVNNSTTFTPGGLGQGGGYAFYQGYVNAGDVLWCSVGGAGGGGGMGAASLATGLQISAWTSTGVSLCQDTPNHKNTSSSK